MRKIKEMLRLHHEVGLKQREIARSLGISHSTVGDLLGRIKALGLAWPIPEDLDEAALEEILYPGNAGLSRRRAEPDWDQAHRELRRKGVTLQLLWLEYREQNPDGYQYSQFCERYRRFSERLDLVMRQKYRAGETMLVDFVGQTMPVIDPVTGEIREAQVFAAVLAASNYTYAEACWTQALDCWIGAHCRAFEFFGGVPEKVVPDNLKAGVKAPGYYEPDLNPTYQEMAAYYGTVVIPARPGHPRDKGKVEAAVLIVERQILARLRRRTFFSLGELNQAIREELARLNNRPFQKLEGSRRSLFESLEASALKPLPPQRYEFAQWKKARVNIDYHVEVDHNYYSVPHEFCRKEVEVRLTAATVEILFRGRRIASHRRSAGRGHYATEFAHMPKAHQKYLNRTPSRLIEEARQIGPATASFIEAILADRPHPEQGYRACLGILRLAKRYPKERMEAAAQRALRSGFRSYRRFQSILDHGLDRIPLEPRPALPSVSHANVRGPHYFDTKGASTC